MHDHGRIDIHSHLLPGIDDGCRTLDESLTCVRALMSAGFSGSICTPHVFPELYPDNVPANIGQWVAELESALRDAGLGYTLWAGGEVRLHRGAVAWMRDHGAPTLAGTNRVLVDMWADHWPAWADDALGWLLDEGYQPILAHPERININDLEAFRGHLDDIQSAGVWLQGNLQCLTGEQGRRAQRYVRDFLDHDRIKIMALDMHRPDTLSARLDGLRMLGEGYGRSAADALLIDAPRQLVLEQRDAIAAG